MKQTGSVQVYLLVLVLIGLTGLMFVDPWVIRLALILIIVLLGYTAFKLEASRVQEIWSEKLQYEEQRHVANVLQIVNRLRHDWMNDMQIFFGYIQLKKFDNLRPYMEKIKENMQQESNLSKLGIPSLIAYIISYRVKSKWLQLEVELDQEVNLGQLPLRDGLVESLVRRVLGLFEQYAAGSGDEHGVLSLAFDVQEEALLLDFAYQGPYDQAGMEVAIREALRESKDVSLDQQGWQDEEAVVTIRLPFRSHRGLLAASG